MTEEIIQPAPTENSHIHVDDGIHPPTLVPRNQCLRHLAQAQERYLLEAERRGWLALRLARIEIQNVKKEELLQYAARDILEHPPEKESDRLAKVVSAPMTEHLGEGAPSERMWKEPFSMRKQRIEGNQAALVETRNLLDHASSQLFADHPVNILVRQAIAELSKVVLG